MNRRITLVALLVVLGAALSVQVFWPVVADLQLMPAAEQVPEGFRAVPEHGDLHQGETVAPQDASLARAADDGEGSADVRTVQILVRDSDKTPIAGAAVTLRATDRTLTTDGAGLCAATVVVTEKNLSLRIEAEGFHHSVRFWPWAEEVKVTLYRTGPLHGHVRDAVTGAPIPGAEIQQQHTSCKGCDPDSFVADARGDAVLPAVKRGSPTAFIISAAGYPLQRFWFKVRAELAQPEFTFRLRRGIEVSGRVFDAISGEGLVGATVRDLRASWHDPVATVGDGGFRILVLPEAEPLKVKLQVRHGGYCIVNWTSDVLRDTGPVGLNVALLAAHAIEVRVRDGAGQPVPGARVTLRARGPRPKAEDLPWYRGRSGTWRVRDEEGRGTIRTGDDGLARLPGLVPGDRKYSLTASKAGFERAQRDGSLTTASGQVLRVEMTLVSHGRTGTVVGRLLLNGEPTFGTIKWQGRDRKSSSSAGKDGTFRLQGVEPGTVTVTGRPRTRQQPWGVNGPQGAITVQAEVQVVAGAETEVELAVVAQFAPISGRVTRSNGNPVAGEWVSARESNQKSPVHAQTDDDGSYSLECHPQGGPYTVSTSVGRATASVEGVAPGSAGVDLVLPAAGVVRVRAFEGMTHNQVPRIAVWWRSLGETRFRRMYNFGNSWVDSEGYHEFRVPASVFDLRVEDTARRRVPVVRERVRVREDGATAVEVLLEEGFGVTLRLSFANAKVVRSARGLLVPAHLIEAVRALKPRQWVAISQQWGAVDERLIGSRFVRFDAQGKGEVHGLPAGTYRLLLQVGSKVVEAEAPAIALGPGAPKVVEVVWPGK